MTASAWLPCVWTRGTRYGWAQFPGDLAGGAVAALIALPYDLAIASLMSLLPVLGVFTSALTAPITVLLGRNPMLIVGTASATVPFVAVAERNQGIGGAPRVSIVAPVIRRGCCVMRQGRHAHVPDALVSGFSCGIGGMMLVSQLDVICDIALRVSRSATSALGQFFAFLDYLGATHPVPLLLGLTIISAAATAGRVSPRIPAPLAGVVPAVLVTAAFLATAFAVMRVNAVLAVAIGCSRYALRYVYHRFWGAGQVPEPAGNA